MTTESDRSTPQSPPRSTTAIIAWGSFFLLAAVNALSISVIRVNVTDAWILRLIFPVLAGCCFGIALWRGSRIARCISLGLLAVAAFLAYSGTASL